MWVICYVGLIVLVNVLFANFPEHSAWWSLIVGLVFVARDLAQRVVGHWVLAAMAVAAALSWWMADPFVAVASASAFVVAEIVDWGVYTWTRRPLSYRVLISSAIAVPIDSVVFLGIVGILTPQLLALQIGSKLAGALVVWFGIWGWERGREGQA